MKKILISVMVIAVAVGLVASASGAFFSDTETSTGNVMTAGTIDLKVNNDNPWTSAAVTTELGDVKPCEVRWVNITLENVGTNPMDVWKMITDVVTDGGKAVYPDPTSGPASSEPEHSEGSIGGTPYVEKCDIDTVITYDLVVNGVVLISEDLDLQISEIEDRYIYLGEIASGNTMTVEQSYHMNADTGNWAQGDTMTFTMEFFAQQTVGNPPPPSPELLRIVSSELYYSATGWGGWSCPAGTFVVGGGYLPSTATVLISQAAKAGVGTYPVYPHYTYTPPEEGWVVQNDNDSETIQICVFCAP
jgi:spore coat-associated protein N